jgi:hypothetical protein
MSAHQEYWDACLIRVWRSSGSVLDALSMFYSITGKKLDEFDPPLLRTPRLGFPWKVGIKVFVSSHLSKVSKRLWEQPPERDIALLHKLKDSKYDTEKDTIKDTTLDAEVRAYKRNRSKQSYTTHAVSDRNHGTDWNVVKGSRK